MKKLIGKIYRYFFWSNLYPVSKIWDLIILDRMGKYDFKIKNKFEVELGDLTLWIENYPYAYLRDNSSKTNMYFIPKKETRYIAKKRIDKVFDEQILKSFPINDQS